MSHRGERRQQLGTCDEYVETSHDDAVCLLWLLNRVTARLKEFI